MEGMGCPGARPPGATPGFQPACARHARFCKHVPSLPFSVKPCDRCKVTTINQQTGEEGLEPLATLREFRSGRALGWTHAPGGAVFFATNLVARQRGVVRVGDAVAVLGMWPGEPLPRGAAS